jgi:hypothetical protein
VAIDLEVNKDSIKWQGASNISNNTMKSVLIDVTTFLGMAVWTHTYIISHGAAANEVGKVKCKRGTGIEVRADFLSTTGKITIKHTGAIKPGIKSLSDKGCPAA